MSLYDDASIILTPNAYKASKLYSLKPTNGTADFNVVRATTATRVNEDGLIESVGVNVPRLDYSGGVCPSILVEPQATNLLLRSQEFNNASWLKTSVTVTANAVTSPDGTTTADTITESATTSVHQLKQNIALTAVNHTWSLFVKPNGRKNVILWSDTASKGTAFDLNAGTITSETSSVGKITALTNGWFKISTTILGTGGVNVSLYFINDSGNASYLGDGVSGVYVWGAQLELGSYATSYIPTTSSTVTRNADVIGGAGDVNTFNSEEGVLFVEMSALANDLTNRFIVLSNGTSNNTIAVYYTSVSNRIRYIYEIGGVQSCSITYDSATITDLNKIALKWKVNDFSLWVNGTEVGTDISGAVHAANTINNLSLKRSDGLDFFGKIKQLIVYKTALTDTELTTLTTP